MDQRQARREKLGASKPIQQSSTTYAGSINSFVPAPGLEQNQNHQTLNPFNQENQPSGNISIDGTPLKYSYGEEQEVDGRQGYVSNDVAPSGTRQGMMGFRGQNMQRDLGQVADTDASTFERLDMDYYGMAALDRANKNYAASSDRNPPFQVNGMGMGGSSATAMNPQLQEPPTRIGQELGLSGVPSAQGINMAPSTGLDIAPGGVTKIAKGKNTERRIS